MYNYPWELARDTNSKQGQYVSSTANCIQFNILRYISSVCLWFSVYSTIFSNKTGHCDISEIVELMLLKLIYFLYLSIYLYIVFVYWSTSSFHQLSIVASVVLLHGRKLKMMCYLHSLHTNMRLPTSVFDLKLTRWKLLLDDVQCLVRVVINRYRICKRSYYFLNLSTSCMPT
jgi:hypothetical protein